MPSKPCGSSSTTPEMIAQTYPDPTFPFDVAMTPEVLGHIQTDAQFLLEAGLIRQAVDVNAWVNKSVALKPA